MATTIQIKRSSGNSAPSTLKLGELAYTYGTGTQGNNGDRLFIGEGGTGGDGNANNVTVIGGQFFADQMDHVAGTLTASSALLVDANKAIDELFVGNNSSAGGTVKLNEGTSNGTNFVGLKAANSIGTSVTFTLPSSDGSNGQILKTDGSGNLSFGAGAGGSLTIAADSGSNDDVAVGSDTLTFAGGTGIDSTVSDNQISYAIDSTVTTLTGSQTLTNKSLTAPVITGSATSAGKILFKEDTDNGTNAVTLIGPASTADVTVVLPNAAGTLALANADTTGNAATATALETARTIHGVSFDGTANIDLTEVIEDTVGAMVSSNTETGISVAYQDADGTIDFALSAAQTTITSLLATDIKIGEDDETKIDFETADEIHFYAANAEQIKLVDGALVPSTDNDIDLGTSSAEFKNAFFDGTVTSDAFAGPLTGDVTGTSSKVTVTDSNANTNFPVVFHDESNSLLDDTGALRYNPSTGTLLVPNLTVAGTTTQVDTVTMNAQNAVVFEGATANDFETTLTITDPTADRTATLPDATGTIALTSSDITGNAATATALETARTIHGVSFDGTGNIDLTEVIEDTVGAMVSSNTETGLAVTYQDADGTLDFAISAAQTTITSLLATDIKIGEDDETKIDFETADEIHFYAANAHQVKIVDGAIVPATDNDIDLGTSSVEFKNAYFDGTVTSDAFAGPLTGDVTGNADTATALETARTIHGVSFDGTANIDLTEVVQDTVGAMFSSNTETNITATYQDGDGTVDLVIADASTSAKGVALFSSDNFTVSSGTVTVTTIDGGTF